LIIRIHPAEIRGLIPSRQKMAEEINKVYPELPKHIIVIPPEDNVSTYAVMLQCNAAIIYNTKTGIELSAHGIPIIVSGEAWIRNKGFAIDVENPERYFRILNTLPFKKQMSSEDTLKAKKYAYHFFFRRMIPLNFIEPGKYVIYKLNLSGIEKLQKGQCKELDLICNGILNRTDFINPVEVH